ncbi:MAG: REP-associated tyrosine transposase [Adhaeribacter sp.]
MPSKYLLSNPEGIYFITFATVQWADVLTRPHYKNIMVESLRYCQEKKGLDLYAWCLMTNHVHLIASARESFKLSEILRDFKKYTAKKLILALQNPEESRKNWLLWLCRAAGQRNVNNQEYQLWQQDNHPVELTTNTMMTQRLDYLHKNPVKEGIVFEAENYVYSSAIDYAGGKGLLKLAALL